MAVYTKYTVSTQSYSSILEMDKVSYRVMHKRSFRSFQVHPHEAALPGYGTLPLCLMSWLPFWVCLIDSKAHTDTHIDTHSATHTHTDTHTDTYWHTHSTYGYTNTDTTQATRYTYGACLLHLKWCIGHPIFFSPFLSCSHSGHPCQLTIYVKPMIRPGFYCPSAVAKWSKTSFVGKFFLPRCKKSHLTNYQKIFELINFILFAFVLESGKCLILF